VHTVPAVPTARRSLPPVKVRSRRRPRAFLQTLVTLTRRGRTAHAPEPSRRRALLLQIDGLSSRRLREALARGEMPHLKALLDEGSHHLRSIRAATPTSTPVFTAGLLYGERGGVPGFGWFDRRLGRVVRMDLEADVSALEAEIIGRADGPPLVRDGVTYGTIWAGSAREAFFNVVRFLYGAANPRAIVHDIWDVASTSVAASHIAGRLLARFALELGVGIHDLQRWVRRVGTSRFEWRFLMMRLFVSVVMRDLSTQGAILDLCRGVPVVYIDFLGYDEYAHRRGPDSHMALYNLRGIDHCIGRLVRTARAVPEYRYDVWVFSDHGQSATQPFERVMGEDLLSFVLGRAARDRALDVDGEALAELSALRQEKMLTRSLWRPLRPIAHARAALRRWRLERRLGPVERTPLDHVEVVTGGSIAHVYFGRHRSDGPGPTLEELRARWPGVLDALAGCRAIGLAVARTDDGGVAVAWRGRWSSLDDRALDALPPFVAVGPELLRRHLTRAALGRRSGDVVVYGAFAEAGNVAFDFEFGSHGGVAPEELDQFLMVPRGVDCALDGEVAAEEFYRLFSSAYGARRRKGTRRAA